MNNNTTLLLQKSVCVWQPKKPVSYFGDYYHQHQLQLQLLQIINTTPTNSITHTLM